MPVVMGSTGMNVIRDVDSFINIGASGNFVNDESYFEQDVYLNFKSFDIFITYDTESYLSEGEYHRLNVYNTRIDDGDNIVVNIASDHREIRTNVYNIEDGYCIIELLNDTDLDIPDPTDNVNKIVKVTVTIIT